MKKIQSLLKTNPELERINLSFLQIESINDIIFELFHFDKLKEVDLSCNRLTTVPKDLSILKTVERLDLSSNLFEDIPAVFSALNTMPSLKELNLTFDTKKLKNAIGFYMPKLEVINGDVIKAGGESKLRNPIVKMSEGKVEVSRSKSSSRKILSNPFLIFDDEFVLIRAFTQALAIANQENNSNPKYQTKEYIDDNKKVDLTVKQTLEFNENLMSKVDNGEITKNFECLNEKKKMISGIVNSYLKLLKFTGPKTHAIVDPLMKLQGLLLNNVEQQGAALKLNVGEKPEKIESSKTKVGKSAEEVKEANGAEQKAEDIEKSLLKLKVAELESELHETRKENDDLYKFIVSHSKNEVLKFTKKMNKKYVQKNPQEEKSTANLGEKEKSATKDKIKTQEKGKKGFLAMKGYTLRQMNDLIHDIMMNKKAYDQRVSTKQAEPETLENFIYLYFKQKYGLKDLIMVEVASVVEKIKSFAPQSAMIEVFKSILKNELDEKFYWMLESMKTNIKAKLENCYKSKGKKNASQAELSNYVTSKINGLLDWDEAEYVLENSFDERELKAAKKKFKDYFHEHLKEQDGKSGISYFDFVEYIFRREIEKHQLLLAHISQFFNKADDDKDGLISKKQLLSLLEVYALRNPKMNVQEIAKEMDPNGMNKITFSKVIEVLGAHHTDDAKKINLIQYLHSM